MMESLKTFAKHIKWYIVYDTTNLKPEDYKDVALSLVKYHWIYQLHIDGGVTGSSQRNLALDVIKDSWVYCLDDDNLLHPNLIPIVLELEDEIKGVVVGQGLETSYRAANTGMIRATHIDTAQFVLDRSIIGDTRFKHEYCADGHFVEEIYNRNKGSFLVIDQELSYYNKLRWGM